MLKPTSPIPLREEEIDQRIGVGDAVGGEDRDGVEGNTGAPELADAAQGAVEAAAAAAILPPCVVDVPRPVDADANLHAVAQE